MVTFAKDAAGLIGFDLDVDIHALPIIVFGCWARSVLGLDFSDSLWIWTDETTINFSDPVGSRAFRNDWCPPEGKIPFSANILITVDNEYGLYVNGLWVGSGSDWQTVQSYCVSLTPGCNTFAVNATNDVGTAANPGAVLAAIQITYTDGTTYNLVSDTTWRYSLTVPFDSLQPGTPVQNWPFAVEQSPYGVWPWGTLQLPPQPAELTLKDANWIWTNELRRIGFNGSYLPLPVGSRAFRKEVILPSGRAAVAALVTMAADDQYSLYVQGEFIGSGTAWTTAQPYAVTFPTPLTQITIAVSATNTGSLAGLIAAVQLVLNDDGCAPFTSIVTDVSWKFATSPSDGWQSPTFDDSSWLNAVVIGPYGISPWGDITISA
ncbi:hypothetical protein CVT26_008906 [Gymnopilus dilepis]|uniref:Uncharacterized protein n=1 Tax=Gymnopilus dilepis TaxID=231916 RepID=A0A409YAU1_9AGAR|nr:hypothetical protein CVT26_008906 [Gymnopilus dilepis]